MLATNQSKIRPTNGEINVTPASAHATACKITKLLITFKDFNIGMNYIFVDFKDLSIHRSLHIDKIHKFGLYSVCE